MLKAFFLVKLTKEIDPLSAIILLIISVQYNYIQYAQGCLDLKETTTFLYTTVRETAYSVSQHHGHPIEGPWNLSDHHNTIVLRGWGPYSGPHYA